MFHKQSIGIVGYDSECWNASFTCGNHRFNPWHYMIPHYCLGDSWAPCQEIFTGCSPPKIQTGADFGFFLIFKINCQIRMIKRSRFDHLQLNGPLSPGNNYITWCQSNKQANRKIHMQNLTTSQDYLVPDTNHYYLFQLFLTFYFCSYPNPTIF